MMKPLKSDCMASKYMLRRIKFLVFNKYCLDDHNHLYLLEQTQALTILSIEYNMIPGIVHCHRLNFDKISPESLDNALSIQYYRVLPTFDHINGKVIMHYI